MKNPNLSFVICLFSLLISLCGYSQNENVEEEFLFGKSFVFERVYSYAGCSEEHAHSDKSVIRLKIDIDTRGRVTGRYGSVPCLESDSTYGEITGYAYSNLVFILYRFSTEGTTFTLPLILFKFDDSMAVLSSGQSIIQIDDKIDENEYPIEQKLLQISPPPKMK